MARAGTRGEGRERIQNRSNYTEEGIRVKTTVLSGGVRPLRCATAVSLVLWMLAAPGPLASAHPPESDTLDNAYARVLHNTAACAQAHTAGFGTRLIVALSRVHVVSGRDSLSLDRGEVAVF